MSVQFWARTFALDGRVASSFTTQLPAVPWPVSAERNRAGNLPTGSESKLNTSGFTGLDEGACPGDFLACAAVLRPSPPANSAKQQIATNHNFLPFAISFLLFISVSTCSVPEYFIANPHSTLRKGTDRAPRPVAIRVAGFPEPIDPSRPQPFSTSSIPKPS